MSFLGFRRNNFSYLKRQQQDKCWTLIKSWIYTILINDSDIIICCFNFHRRTSIKENKIPTLMYFYLRLLIGNSKTSFYSVNFHCKTICMDYYRFRFIWFNTHYSQYLTLFLLQRRFWLQLRDSHILTVQNRNPVLVQTGSI